MKLTVSYRCPGKADGIYRLKVKDCIAAVLYWADDDGALEGWSSFACLPVDAYGNGSFHYKGGRSIPPGASHILARAVTADFGKVQEQLFPLPAAMREEKNGILSAAGPEKRRRFCVMSDLHLTGEAKARMLDKVLRRADDFDALFLTGDLVNDGTPEQFRRLKCCIDGLPERLPVLAAAGNHDYPQNPLPRVADGPEDYPGFQEYLRNRPAAEGMWDQDESGAYAVRIGDAEIIGLNGATHGRRLRMKGEGQLRFLDHRLRVSDAKWRIVLCHAPLLAHNPQGGRQEVPYLNVDHQLQKILDGRKHTIYLSGHTHLSPNSAQGCAEYQQDGKRIYLSAGSVCPTALHAETSMSPPEWASGIYWELALREGSAELCARSVHSELKFPRGYYWFKGDETG